MKAQSISISKFVAGTCFLFGAASLYFASAPVKADPITPEMQAKVDKYKHKLVEWAGNPTIVSAVKEANAKGPIAGMSNSKWDELSEKDAQVTAIQSSAAGKLVHDWEKDKAVGKVFARDEKGNIVAASAKPLLYNNASKPPFMGAIKGQPFHSPEMKPDPTTQEKSVQIAAPVMDGGKVIGVLHASVVQ